MGFVSSLKTDKELLMPDFAKIILDQIGGHKFVVMTGAKNFCYSEKEKFLSFSIGRNSKGVNKVKITLTPWDDYTMQFAFVRGTNCKIKATVEGVYCDMLQDVFTMNTGLYTKL